MRLLTCLTIGITLLAAPVLAQTPSDIETQAKQELNEAARLYKEGNFAEAQAHSERAMMLDPQNKIAPYFVARSIHSQYKPGDVTPENVARARQAIAAYQRVLERAHGDDEAYKAVAYLYGALKENELMRQWIFQRAVDVSMSNEKRAEAYVVLASKDWDCSFKITDLSENKLAKIKGERVYVVYRMPKERADYDRAKACANRALGLIDMAITLTPENESAWAYKTNVVLELAKLAQMAGDVQNQQKFERQYQEALRQTTRLSKDPQLHP